MSPARQQQLLRDLNTWPESIRRKLMRIQATWTEEDFRRHERGPDVDSEPMEVLAWHRPYVIKDVA